MKYINTFNDGDNISGIYLCKQKNTAVTKNGKDYENLTLIDRTGSIAGKIWDPNSMGIGDFEANDYIEITGKVSLFNNALQLRVDRAFKAHEGTYDPADYVPVSAYDINDMWARLITLINTIQAPYYKALLKSFFDDPVFADTFRKNSAAKTVHHNYMGGLLQHTLSVTRICDFFSHHYGSILNRDLLLTAAILHDVGKTKELSDFPLNDYTDEGQLIGHIVIGTGMIMEKFPQIPDFPETKKNELIHCILAHHGELEYGSPKLPSLIEAVALSYADNVDAKLEVFKAATEEPAQQSDGWLGFNRFLNTNIRKTT